MSDNFIEVVDPPAQNLKLRDGWIVDVEARSPPIMNMQAVHPDPQPLS